MQHPETSHCHSLTGSTGCYLSSWLGMGLCWVPAVPARGLWLWAGVSPAPCPVSRGHTGDPVTLLEVRCESAGGLVSSCLFLLLIFIASINVESQLGRLLLLALLTQCWGRMSLRRDRNRCSPVLCLPWPGWGQGLGVPSALGWCSLPPGDREDVRAERDRNTCVLTGGIVQRAAPFPSPSPQPPALSLLVGVWGASSPPLHCLLLAAEPCPGLVPLG